MGQQESSLASTSAGYLLPVSAASSSSLSSSPPNGSARRPRLDMRWSRLTMDQLRDEEFLTKQLRRMETLVGVSARRRAAANATTGTSSSATSSSASASSGRVVFVDATPSRSSLQQRLIYGKAGVPSDEQAEDESFTGIVGDASTRHTDALGSCADSDAETRKELDVLNALYLLGELEQPELAALMLHKLKELLQRYCTFPDPFYELLALRRHILRSVYEAVQVQHHHQRALASLTASAMENILKGMPHTRIPQAPRPLSVGSSMVSARGRSSSTRSIAQALDVLPGSMLPIKPKEKVSREASMGIQVVFSLFSSVVDQSSSSLIQKKEFLAEILPLIRSLPPHALAPKRLLQSLPNSKGMAPDRGCNAVSSIAASESQELVDKIQRFLLEICPLSSPKPGPSSPKVHAVVSPSSEFDATDRTNAVNGLIYLAAARSSLRDFLIAVKVILGASDHSNDAKASPPSQLSASLVSPRLSSPNTASVPLLEPKTEDQHPASFLSEWEKDDIVGKHRSKMDVGVAELKVGTPSHRGDSVASGKVDPEMTNSTAQDLVIQVKRKALPKGFVPKAVGTVSTTTTVNAAHPVGHHRFAGAHGPGMINAGGGYKSKLKEDMKELLQNGNAGFSLDMSTMQESGSRDSFAAATSRHDGSVQTMRCPKFRPLSVSSVLHELDVAKVCVPQNATRSSRAVQRSLSNFKSGDVCSSGGVHSDSIFLPGEDDCEDREVWSCGQNSYGELGHGDTITRKSFDRIEALQRKDVIQVSAGNEHSIVLCGDGTVLTCGYNDNGQCGVGVANRVSTVTEVHKFGDHTASQIHAYNGCEHSVIVTQDGRAATFGYNYRGQLGHGNTTSENVPKLVRSLEGRIVRLVSCSYYHTILTCEDAGGGREYVYTFGRNDYGQLGHNDTIDRKVPHHIEALADQHVVSVACGQYHTMVVSSTGKVYGFGKNDYGQLGTDSPENHLSPVQVRSGLEKQVCLEIRCGYYHSIVLCGGAHLYGFGRNDYGQLGLGKANASASANLQLQQQRFASPQLIEELEGKEIIRFACGCYHTIAVSDNGVLFVFGRNNHGQLGTGDTNERLYPFPIEDFLGKRIAMVAAGFYHTIVLTGGKEEEKCDQGGETGNIDEEKGDGHLLGPSIISSSSILSARNVRQILDTRGAQLEHVDHDEADSMRVAERAEVSGDPSCDPDDEDRRDEDTSRSKGCNVGSVLEDASAFTNKPAKGGGGVDSVDAAVIIFAELDRLCKPFLPKRGSYPILQHPNVETIELLGSSVQASPSSNVDICGLFDGCFEANAIHVCSSTFESLCALLKHLSGKRIESLVHAQSHLHAPSQKLSSSGSSLHGGTSSTQLQVYILLVCIRLLQANLAQLLRSGLGKAIIMFSLGREVETDSGDQGNASAHVDVHPSVKELERMLRAIRQIRDSLMALVDVNQRTNSFLGADPETSNGESVMRISSEAVETLMLAFELFFPCQCAQRQFLLYVIENHRATSTSDCACSEKACPSTAESYPRSRKLVIGPLLRRMAEDSLVLKFLPLAANAPLSNSNRSTKANLSAISTIYAALLERIATDFTRALGEAADFSGDTCSMVFSNTKSALSSLSSLFNVLLVIQKHVATWAASCTRWQKQIHEYTNQELNMVERVAMLVDRVLRVDERDMDDIPLPWRCFIEFSLAILSQCCDVFRQAISKESIPSPSFGHKGPNATLAAGGEDAMIDKSLVEVVEASIVGQLLPSLVSSLLVFSSNPLFAATLLPRVNNLLRLLDDFNQHNQETRDTERNLGLKTRSVIAGTHSGSASSRVKQSGNSRFGSGRGSESNCSGVNGGSIGEVMSLPWSFLLEKDLAVLAAEMAVTLKIGDSYFGCEDARSASPCISRRWVSSPLFLGGLNPSLLRRSIKQSKNPQAPISDVTRIVQHMPFSVTGRGEPSTIGDAAPFSLVLPPSRHTFSAAEAMWRHNSKRLPNGSSMEEYTSIFGEESTRNFLDCLSGRQMGDCCATARSLCDWIREHYAKSNASYRMLMRQTRAPATQSSLPENGDILDGDSQLEYAAFAAILHHTRLSHLALHFTLNQEKRTPSKPPPRVFLLLWYSVAELRRRFSAKKTEIKNAAFADNGSEKEPSMIDVATLRQTIIDRCQLLCLVSIPYEEERMQTTLDSGFLAPWDPPFAEGASKLVEFPSRSLQKQSQTVYGDQQLPFLSAFPDSRWRKIRVLFHVVTRWKWIGCVRHRSDALRNGISREVLDFITTDEPVSTPTAVNELLVDPSRRASCSGRGLEFMCEVLAIPAFESIQADVIHRISQVLVFQPHNAESALMRTKRSNVGAFYKEFCNSSLSEFLTQLTQMIVQKANVLLTVSESEGAANCRPLFMMLSCWALHFQDDQFEFVNDIGILAILQEMSKCIASVRRSTSLVDSAGGDQYLHLHNWKSFDQLDDMVWVLTRYICVHLGAQASRPDGSVDLDEPFAIDVPAEPALSDIFDLLFDQTLEISQSMLSSAGSVTSATDEAVDKDSVPDTPRLTNSSPASSTMRRSFEIILAPKRFSFLSKGLSFSYDEMINPSVSVLSAGTRPAMSPLIKPNEFSITTWIYISDAQSPTTTPSASPTLSPRLEDVRLVFLRGNDNVIAPSLMLVPESDTTWQFEVGLVINLRPELGRAAAASTSMSSKHIVLERLTSKESVSCDKWTHVAIVLDASKIRLYLNGILDNQRALPPAHASALASASVDLPFHFGKCPANVLSPTPQPSSPTFSPIASSLRLLASSLGFAGDSKRHVGHFSATASDERSERAIKSFDGSLGHFRFHNRSLSPIHVRIVFDEKKQGESASVSTPRSPSLLRRTDDQQRKLTDQLAVLLLLSSSSEGLLHMTSHGSQWLKLLWEVFIKVDVFRVQQSVLRVLRAILPYQSPMTLSQVLTHDVHSASLTDETLTTTLGFNSRRDVFVQQIIRIVGFSECNHPHCDIEASPEEQEEQKHFLLPWTLMLPVGIHGNEFSPECDELRSVHWDLQENMEKHDQTAAMQALALRNELVELLHHLFACSGNASEWRDSIQRSLLCGLSVASACRLKRSTTLFRMGKRLVRSDIVKAAEEVACFHILSGVVDFMRPGATIELTQTGDIAHIIAVEHADLSAPTGALAVGRSKRSTSKRSLAYLTINDYGKREVPASSGLLSAGGMYDVWYERVLRYSKLHQSRSDLDTQGNRPDIPAPRPRYVCLNTEDLRPVKLLSTSKLSSSRAPSILYGSRDSSDDFRKLLVHQITERFVQQLDSASDYADGHEDLKSSGQLKLMRMRSRNLAMKAILQAASSPASALELLSHGALMDQLVQMSVSDDGSSSFATAAEVERKVWLLRQRVYRVLVDLGDEAEDELQQVFSAPSLASSRSNPDTAVSAFMKEDEECAASSPEAHDNETDVPFLQQDESTPRLGTRRDSHPDMDESEGIEDEGFTDVGLIQDDSSTEAKDDDDDDDDDGGEDDEDDGDDDELEEDEDEEDEDEEAEENRAEFVEELMLMGFPEEWCVLALKQTENDIVCASAWIVDNLEYLSRLQSSLDKQLDRGCDTPRFNEEEDDATTEDSPALDADNRSTTGGASLSDSGHAEHTKASETIPDGLSPQRLPSDDSDRANIDGLAPPLNDKEMARKVFGEMYFPFEEGGYRSNTRHCYMRSWRAESVEMKLLSLSKPQTAEGTLDDAASFEDNMHDPSLYLSQINQMDFKGMVDTLHDLERSLSILFARQCVVTLWFHLSMRLDSPSEATLYSMSYPRFFQLMKMVLLRGNQFNVVVQDDRRGQLQEKSPEDVLSSATSFFLAHDFDGFLVAAFDFCLVEIEKAASNKPYEAYLWTQRDLQRSDQAVIEEPGIELVSWLVDALLASGSASWKVSQAITRLIKRLRFSLKAANLPLKFLTLHTISAVLQKLPKESAELVRSVIVESKLVFGDFLHAAKQRHSRELVQHRLLFSLYLQAYIEILHVLHQIPGLDTKSMGRALPADPFVSLSSPLTKLPTKDRATRSLSFDRKRCRSNLLTISEDAFSVGYAGNEVWRTVFATESFATGVISWELRVEKSSSSYIFVGVANSRASSDSFLGADDHSWGYIGDKALYYQRNRVKAYGDAFGEGDCVGVHLDCERGTLSFSKNGVNLGVAFENIVGEVYPAVAFYSRHQRVSFVKESLVIDRGEGAIPSATPCEDAKVPSDNNLLDAFEGSTPGSVEEGLVACELMASMIDKQPVRRELLHSAYEMTAQWIAGSKKYVTTRAGKPLWVDITHGSCLAFGFQSGERVRTSRGNGVVVGVAEQRLWVEVDGEQGAWFFHPSKLRSLALISVNASSKAFPSANGSTSGAVDAPNSASDSVAKKTVALSHNEETQERGSMVPATLSFAEFEDFVNDPRWSLPIDRELISLVNDFCETSSVSPWNISPTEMLEIFRLKESELETAMGAVHFSPSKPSHGTRIVARMGFLRFFNAYFSRVIGYFDLTWHYFSPDSSLLPCKLVSRCRGSLFIALKNEFFTALMEKTANAPKKGDDDYDYPEDLPQVLINRPKAATAKCHPGSTKSLFLSMFGQAFEELHFLPLKMLRMVYSHPMDDGQLRSFKVKFEGEGVDDYGGPYREFFSQFFAELQMLRTGNDDDPGSQQQNSSAAADPKLEESPTECLLPFLLPSPNWRNGVGANRERFVINASLLRDGSTLRDGIQSPANRRNNTNASDIDPQSADLEHENPREKRELHAEMLFFLGQMLGTCLRTRVCVRLDLATSVWKHLVGEVDDESADHEDVALQNLKEVDFVAYTLWKSLRAMLSEYQTLQSLGISHEDRRFQDLKEQLGSMDLTFSVFLSDGQVFELCDGGSDKAVTLDNLEAYLSAVIRARMEESDDVMNIVKQGLNSILPVAALSLYTWKELEKRVGGVAEVDVDLLKQNTEYDEDVSAQDEFVQRFWRVLASMDEDDKRCFLRFVWARSRLPAGTAQFHQKFKIQSLASTSANGGGTNGETSGSASATGGWMDSQLPKSHTCFFALQLPRYSTDEICRKQMLYAIRNCVEMDGDFRLADAEMTGWNDINPNDQLRF